MKSFDELSYLPYGDSQNPKTRSISFSTTIQRDLIFKDLFLSLQCVYLCVSLRILSYRDKSNSERDAGNRERFYADRHGLLVTSTRWRSRPRQRCNIAWRICSVTITSFQVFTTTRRHRTHLYLSGRVHSYACAVCYGHVVSSLRRTPRLAARRREWRDLRAVSTASPCIGQF